jgi:Tfp pilus assembly protein FimT
LIECLAVLAITALAGAIAFPSLERAITAAALDQSTQALAADLREARGRALAGGQVETLAIAADGASFGWDGRLTQRLSHDVLLAEDGGGHVAFFPDGSVTPGRLSLSAGARRAIVVVSSTGLVSVGDPRAPRPPS